MAFTLHLPTLLIMSVALNFLISLLLLWIYTLRKRQPCFRLWALACGVFSVGSLLAGARVVIDLPIVTVFLAHGFLGLSPLLLLSGLQVFIRLPAKHNLRYRRTAYICFSVYLLSLLATYRQDPLAIRAVTAMFSALVFSVAVYRLSAIATLIRLPARMLQALFALHGLIMLAQAGLIAVNLFTGGVERLDYILRLILINHLLLATCTALTLPLMAFSVSEHRLRTLAERDGLTGLYNRRALFSKGAHAFRKARAEGSPMAVLMLDVDHFKAVNDRWGHAAGDNALRLISQTLVEELRDDDIIGRVGGEEFALILPLSQDEDVNGITNRLLSAISARGMEVEGKPMELSASIGGIEMNEHHTSFADLVIEADTALYSAKKNGRNRAEFSPARGALT